MRVTIRHGRSCYAGVVSSRKPLNKSRRG